MASLPPFGIAAFALLELYGFPSTDILHRKREQKQRNKDMGFCYEPEAGSGEVAFQDDLSPHAFLG